jgi:hypothetical protein
LGSGEASGQNNDSLSGEQRSAMKSDDSLARPMDARSGQLMERALMLPSFYSPHSTGLQTWSGDEMKQKLNLTLNSALLGSCLLS